MFAVATACVACTSQSLMPLRCDLPDDATLKSIVQITDNNGGFSSGVVVARNQVLTVAHAVTGENKIFATVAERLVPATVTAVYEDKDLALLSLDTFDLPAMDIAEADLHDQEKVWAIGFPLGKSQRTSLGIFQEQKNGKLFSSAHINQGTSGGGLLRCKSGSDNQYELAGIMRAYIADVSSEQPINTGDSVAVAADQLHKFLVETRQQDMEYSYHPQFAAHRLIPAKYK